MRTPLRTVTALALAVPLIASALPASAASTFMFRDKGTFADVFFEGAGTPGDVPGNYSFASLTFHSSDLAEGFVDTFTCEAGETPWGDENGENACEMAGSYFMWGENMTVVTGKGKGAAVLVSGGVRALPTLGLISILGLSIGIGVEAPIIAFVVLAIPSMLAGAYAGFEAIDRRIVDSARSVGMTEWQIIGRVEVPLGLPLLIGGIRSATLQVIATATLAAYISGGGLGSFIFLGLRTNDYTQMLAGSILVIALAIAFEGAFSALQRLVVPAGVRAGQRKSVRSGSSRSRAAAA